MSMAHELTAAPVLSLSSTEPRTGRAWTLLLAAVTFVVLGFTVVAAAAPAGERATDGATLAAAAPQAALLFRD